MDAKRGLLERLDSGEVIVGDGGYLLLLEKRGYVKAGPWTPECVVEHPEAVKQLHREFQRAGADVLQAFTIYSNEERLSITGAYGNALCCAEINRAACQIAKEVANEGGSLFAGSVSQLSDYISGKKKEDVQQIFRVQAQIFLEMGADFVIAEYIEHIEEMEWAIEVLKETNLPVIATITIGPQGDLSGVSPAECGIRMVNAGADCIGVNCMFDPKIALQTMALMIKGVHEAGLRPHFIIQSCCYHCPDAGSKAFVYLPESPLALEPRLCTRFDIHQYARAAYNLGIRYIGGCCGFEAYHIRAIAEELASERGKVPDGSEKHEPWGLGLRFHTKPWIRARANRDYWEKLRPASGRPNCPSMSKPVSVDDEKVFEGQSEHFTPCQ